MNTVPQMFHAVAMRNASRTAVVDGELAVTYAELEDRVSALAGALHDSGVRLGDRVGLMLRNSLDFVVSYRAICALGAVVVPLNEHYQKAELLYFMNACAVSLLITSQEFASLCQKVVSGYQASCGLILVDEARWQLRTRSIPLQDLWRKIDPDAPLMLQFSSGSTGTPKKIARTHRHLLYELDSLVHALDVKNTDRFIGVAPFSHVNGLVRSMMCSQHAGAALYPVAQFERRAVAGLVEDSRISVFIAVPFMFSTLAQGRFYRRPDFSSLRYCISSSAPMPSKHNRQFHERFGMYVRQLYGSTETGTISVNLGHDIENTLDSVGTPIRGVEVEVFADDGRIAEPGSMGEFAVKSPTAISGYQSLEELNKQVFRNGYFFIGDLGKKDDQARLYLIGRKKFFINKAGFKIDPREIEELLESHHKVDEVVVIGVPRAYGDEKVKAIIVPSAPCTEDEIVSYCRGRIADFKIPSVVEFRDSLPKSPTGKIRRAMLQD
ncbi:MAG: hypothetical protein AMJ93_13000 [Anaerolineae bacterium SM23_84]|nr:MAG: hypothetical protein AMJ93_13000 [Anaerolineae bacterium SM23_84]